MQRVVGALKGYALRGSFGRSLSVTTCALVVLVLLLATPALAVQPQLHQVSVGGGATLHYTDQGAGPPLIFVHGSISDYRSWNAQVAPFSQSYRVITYSRRYNYPNSNPPARGYSAAADAEDLHGLIKALGLKRVFIVGASYGALTTLFLMTKHPEIVQAASLGEPPALPLLLGLPGDDAPKGRAMFEDVEQHMLTPMKAAFVRGDDEAGLNAFFDYVIGQPGAWSTFPPAVRAEQMLNSREWEVILTTGTLFPRITAADVRRIKTPTLLFVGGKTTPFLAMIDAELNRLLPNREHVVFPDAGHPMWLQRPDDCRRETLRFFAAHGGAPVH